MDIRFWLGVLATLVITALANLAHQKIVAYLDSRKLLFAEKRRRTATKFHELIADLQSGRRDRHIYMLRVTMGVLFAMQTFITAAVGSLMVWAMVPYSANLIDLYQMLLQPSRRGPIVAIITLQLLAIFAVVLSARGLRRMREITNALENFEEYDTKFKQKWGPPPS